MRPMMKVGGSPDDGMRQMTAPPLSAPNAQPGADDIGAGWMEAMLAGDFEAAWRQTDRIELPRRAAEAQGGFTRGPEHLVWNGAPFREARVLVRCEHGLGDSIQFLRYCPRLRAEARQVIVKAQPMLLPILEGMAGIDVVRDAWTCDPDPPHDVAIECMELPYACRDAPETLPATVPYLPVDRIRAMAQPVPIPRGGGPAIGVIWASSAWDHSRSIRLAQLAPLGEVPDVHFFSLQQGPEAVEAGRAPFPIVPLSQLTTGTREAAAAMLALDLVISVDSMTAHLAGALGRPVWVLLQHAADWRWMRRRADSPWYPTMRLFRQPAPGDWEGAIRQMAAALRELTAPLP